jgi:hypothetical protein
MSGAHLFRSFNPMYRDPPRHSGRAAGESRNPSVRALGTVDPGSARLCRLSGVTSGNTGRAFLFPAKRAHGREPTKGICTTETQRTQRNTTEGSLCAPCARASLLCVLCGLCGEPFFVFRGNEPMQRSASANPAERAHGTGNAETIRRNPGERPHAKEKIDCLQWVEGWARARCACCNSLKAKNSRQAPCPRHRACTGDSARRGRRRRRTVPGHARPRHGCDGSLVLLCMFYVCS